MTKNDSRQREQQSGGVEPHQAALLPLIVDHVERVEERRHARVRAAEGDQKSHDEGRSNRLVSLAGNDGDLLGDQRKNPVG